jgi:GNAT superfamily N-acetyltransferase
VLSTGECFRADLARTIGNGAVVDEYTSVVDRNVAVSASHALRRWVDESGARGMVFATCHRDVLPWLVPDWVIDLDTRAWALRPRECLQRQGMVVEIREATRAAWDMFRRYHYLNDGPLHPFARCYIASWDDRPVGFVASIPFPNGHLKKAWRGHRTVILPDFQGLGIGVRLSDAVADIHVRQGLRYFSKTSHPRMGRYRDASARWRPTSSNRTRRQAKARFGFRGADGGTDRLTWSHEYVAQAEERP